MSLPIGEEMKQPAKWPTFKFVGLKPLETYTDPQLPLFGDRDQITIVMVTRPLINYVLVTVEIPPEGETVVVHSPEDVGEEETCKEMNRRLMGERVWVQMDLPLKT